MQCEEYLIHKVVKVLKVPSDRNKSDPEIHLGKKKSQQYFCL